MIPNPSRQDLEIYLLILQEFAKHPMHGNPIIHILRYQPNPIIRKPAPRFFARFKDNHNRVLHPCSQFPPFIRLYQLVGSSFFYISQGVGDWVGS